MTDNRRSIPGTMTRAAIRLALLATVFVPAIASAQGTTTTSGPVDTSAENVEDAPEEIVVTGSRASRQNAVARKRLAPTIRDVVSSDQIGRLPDYNTAEAVQRLPGVAIETDQGEARYVIIRGVDPNLNQVTIDGNLVAVPEAEGRRTALDTIPSDLVAAIEIVKAVTPDYDANAIGGSINIVTPTAFDRSGSFGSLTARGNYNEKSDKFGYGGAGLYATKFGDDTFGVAVGGSYFKRFIESDLAEPINYATIAPNVTGPTQYRFYDYRIMRERIGGILNLDYRPNADLRVYVRSIYNEFTDEESRNLFNYTFSRGTPTVNSPTEVSFSRGQATREFRKNDQTQKLYNVSPGVELRFDKLLLDLSYTYAHAQEHTPVRNDIEFRSADVLANTIDLSTPRPRFTAIDPRAFDPAAFPVRRIRLRQEEIDEDLHAFRADLRYEFAEESFIKFGAKYTNRRKVRENSQSQFDPARPVTFADTGSVLPPPDDFYEGDYAFGFGPTIDYPQALRFFEANQSTLFRENAAQTLINDLGVDYDIDETILAGYGMGQFEFGPLRVIAGVRVERTDATYRANSVRDTDGDRVLELSDIVPLSFDQKYTDVLPSVHVNYRPSSAIAIRAAYTNTIGRPNFSDQVPTFSETSGVGTAGNPDLQPYKSMGLDLSAEYYPNRDSIFSAALFYKRIKNPVFSRILLNTDFAGIELTSLTQPFNADKGYILGVEANAQTRFSFLPSPLDGFGASVNVTYADSEVEVVGREREKVPFFRQADWIVNAALFYERGPLEARLAVNFRDDFIVNIGSSTASDIYDKARTVVDARVSYRLFDGFELFGSVSNINDAPQAFYQTIRRQIYSREIYSFNADFGVSLSF